MTNARSFLARRRPPPPQALERRLRIEAPDGEPLEVLKRLGLQELDRARSAPGRIRESAFHLLTADALLTYACEAALETAAPVAALGTLLREAASEER